jgi:integrase/recombinase XerD
MSKTEVTEIEHLASQWLTGRRLRSELGRRSAEIEMSRLRQLFGVHGALPVARLDRATMLRWQMAIGRMAPATRRAYQSTVRMFCSWLVLECHLEADPTVTMVKVAEPIRVPRALTPHDVRLVLEACPDARGRAIVWLMAGCGLRCVEVSRLDRDDYDRDRGTITVRGKGGHERTLPLPLGVRAALDLYLSAGKRRAGPLIQPDPQGKWSPSGRLSAARVSELVSEIMTDAGVHSPGDGYTAHSLRHTCASDVLDRCHDLRLVSEMLGHRSLQATRVYLRRASLDQLRDAMEGREYDRAA